MAVLAAVATACGGTADKNPASQGPGLTALASEGRTIVGDKGCANCHGSEGQGGLGPAWKGLAGSRVKLDDGTTVIADDVYLARSISDPAFQKVAGFGIAMPDFRLDHHQIDAVVAYIKTL